MNTNVLEAPKVETEVDETPKNGENKVRIDLDQLDDPVELDIDRIPIAARWHLLRSAAKSYVTNRVATTQSLTKKANLPFDAYDAAMRHDPLQTHVKRPDGERKIVDYKELVDTAIKALYAGEIGKRGRGPGEAKIPKDPLDAAILRHLVSEKYEAARKADPSYRYFSAQKDIGYDAKAALEAIVERGITFGMDEKTAREWVENRYVKPARMMLGLDKMAGKLKDVEFTPF
jgi:hypothetical protein